MLETVAFGERFFIIGLQGGLAEFFGNGSMPHCILLVLVLLHEKSSRILSIFYGV